MSLKIAFLTPEYPHSKIKHAAGIGTSIKNLAVALAAKNVEVTIFVYGQNTNDVFNDLGVTIHLLKDEKYLFGKWFLYRKHIERYVNKVVNQKGIQLIEAPDWTGITAFMNFCIPLIIRFHGSDTYFCHLEQRKQKLKNYWFEKLAVKKAIGFIAPTTFAGKLSSELLKVSLQKIAIIHNGLELDKFVNDKPDAYENGLLLYIGTIIRKKGVLELPAILHHVRNDFPEAKLVLIGSDSKDVATGNASTWEMIKTKLNHQDKEAVTYFGKIPYEKVQEYIKKAHVCVFPTFAETLGMVTIESMAMQKPVVNSSIGWSQELMEDGKSGFLVHPNEHTKYAQTIVKLLQNKELTNQIGTEARSYVEKHFDIDTIANQNIEFYKKMI